MPQVGFCGSKLNVRNGSSISAVHPSSVRRTRMFQIPSHRLFRKLKNPPAAPSPPDISPSPIRPDGLISKKYPLRPSRNVSIVHMKRSSPSSA